MDFTESPHPHDGELKSSMTNSSAKFNIIVKEINKTFGDNIDRIHVLKGISIDVKKHETAFIVGPSGCGKTTLISIIAGTLSFDSGTIDILGHKLHEMSEQEVTRFRAENIGFIFQKFNLMSSLTCAENVAVPLYVNRNDHAQALKKAKEALDKVGMLHKADRFPSELSGGQQQLVAIARAIVHNPRIIICDEPTSSLDIDNGMKVLKILKGLAQVHDHSVIIVTHDHRIFGFADKIISLDDVRVKSIEESYRQMDNE